MMKVMVRVPGLLTFVPAQLSSAPSFYSLLPLFAYDCVPATHKDMFRFGTRSKPYTTRLCPTKLAINLYPLVPPSPLTF